MNVIQFVNTLISERDFFRLGTITYLPINPINIGNYCECFPIDSTVVKVYDSKPGVRRSIHNSSYAVIFIFDVLLILVPV